MNEEWKIFDDRTLDVIASGILEYCISRGCEKLGETPKEFRVTCPNANCPSREKADTHKAFDINKTTAKFNCFHCGLSGQGLFGSGGLIARLESGNFSFSAFSGKQNINAEFFKPKEKVVAEPVMGKDELPSIANALSKEAVEYFVKRGIPEYVYRDTDLRIFSAPAGTQFSFMKQPLSDTAIFFPIRNEKGEVIHVHYKLLHGGYYMSPGPKPIYLTKATALSSTVICEGVFDALSAYTAGYRGAALLGHEVTGNHDLSIFKEKPVVVMLDNDDAGKASIGTVASILIGVASEVKIATIPSELGKDANDVLVKAGADKLKELIQNAVVYEANAEPTMSNDATEPKTDEAESQEQTTAKVEDVIKPKKEIGIVFPESAWRGIFETYRQAQKGTTEAPNQYHFGVFKTVAGIVVGRTAYIWGGRKLFPNFYTVLLGPTTQSRKSTAASRGTNLLSDIDEAGNVVGADPLVLILRGLSTPAGLLAQLKGQNADDEGLSEIEMSRALATSPCEGYRALIVINEFASLLRQAKKEQGSGIIQLLTDAYDCLGELHNPTKVDPHIAKNAVVSMICLSTRAWLENTLELADLYGGYVCRNLFYEWTETNPIPNPHKPNTSLLNEVTMRLRSMRKAYEDRGKQQLEYQFSFDAQFILEKWYNERWYKDYPSEVIKAAVQRIDENVRKLALLYAILENDEGNLTIHADQLQAAIAVGKYWEAVATQLFSKFGFSKTARMEAYVVELLEKQSYTKRELQQRIGGNMSADEFNRAIDALLKSERIGWTQDKTNKKVKRLILL
jgi:hypothetical protein